MGPGDAGAGGEKGDELTVAATSYCVRSDVGLDVAFEVRHCLHREVLYSALMKSSMLRVRKVPSKRGRTSTTP